MRLVALIVAARRLAEAGEPVSRTPTVIGRSRSRAGESKAGRRRQFAKWRRDPCPYCGSKVETMDHIYPLSRGGAHHPYNRVATCYRCNRLKRGRTVLEFLLATPNPQGHPLRFPRGYAFVGRGGSRAR